MWCNTQCVGACVHGFKPLFSTSHNKIFADIAHDQLSSEIIFVYHLNLILQIRSHAQKYFLKVQKNGTSEHVPPPRPKRKAAHPYPQKASKNGRSSYAHKFSTHPTHISLILTVPPSAQNIYFNIYSHLAEPGYTIKADSSSMLRNSGMNATVSSWTHNSIPPIVASSMVKGLLSVVPLPYKNSNAISIS